MPTAINAIAGTDMNPQFHHAFTHRLRIAKVPRLNLTESGSDSDLGNFVAKAAKPLGVWFASILLLVADEFDHKNDCSIKATTSI